jgi:Na+/melibiose symporter-like transporter
LLIAWSTSMVGDGVRVAALPLFAAVSTRDPLAVSAVAVAEVLPWLLIALPAGALVDRWEPRWVVLSSHGVRAVVTLLLATSVATGSAGVGLLVAAAFVVTAAETFADPASQRLLVHLAGPHGLEKGNGYFISVETMAVDIVGPLAAGVLFLWQPAACFAFDGVSFLLAGIIVTGLPRSLPSSSTDVDYRQASRPLGGMVAQVTEGIRYLFRDRGLRVLVTSVLFAAVSVAAANAVMALYAVEVLGITPALVPTLWVAMGLTTLVAARVVPTLTRRFGDGPVMVAMMAVLAAGFVLLGAVSWQPIGWLGYALVGLGAGGWNVLSATRRQRLTAPPMMGRVTNSYRMLTWGLMPVGAGLAGPVAELTSLGTVYLLAGVLLAGSLVVLARPLLATGAHQCPTGDTPSIR